MFCYAGIHTACENLIPPLSPLQDFKPVVSAIPYSSDMSSLGRYLPHTHTKLQLLNRTR